ncbi:Os02g0255033 [Oryza sativa Japonica Group]|uniref:Os02g0255033 protein n=1 Tax=Oryza sativa subsp. japonica TaxID=39947 RepID=A0A0P0VH60_ORYSJ|nr:hypothetical protein EE612_010168 [Oryza sativa]BAS77938.1 Os02g0255033 [Oryza sativa Japonica Group]
MMKSISFTGSPSRMMQLPSVYSMGFRRSHMASKSFSSMFSNIGTCKCDRQRCLFISLLRFLGRFERRPSSSTPLVSCHLYCS